MKQLDEYLLEFLYLKDISMQSFNDDLYWDWDSDMDMDGRKRFHVMQFQMCALCLCFILSLMWLYGSERFQMEIKDSCEWFIVEVLQFKNKPSLEIEESSESSMITGDTLITKTKHQNIFNQILGFRPKNFSSWLQLRKRLKPTTFDELKKLHSVDQSLTLNSCDLASFDQFSKSNFSIQSGKTENQVTVLEDMKLFNEIDYDTSLTKHGHNQPTQIDLLNISLSRNPVSSKGDSKKIEFVKGENLKNYENLGGKINVMDNLSENTNVTRNWPQSTNVTKNVLKNTRTLRNFPGNKNAVENLSESTNIVHNFPLKNNEIRKRASVSDNIPQHHNVMEGFHKNANVGKDFHRNENLRVKKSLKSNLSKKYSAVDSDQSQEEIVDIFDDVQCFVEKNDVVVLPASSPAYYKENVSECEAERKINVNKILIPDIIEQSGTIRRSLREQSEIERDEDVLNYNMKGKLLNRDSDIDEAASQLLYGELGVILKKYQQKQNSQNVETIIRHLAKMQEKQTPERVKETTGTKLPSLKVSIHLAKDSSDSSSCSNSTRKEYSKNVDIHFCPYTNESEICDNSRDITLADSFTIKPRREDRFKSSTSSWSDLRAVSWTEDTRAYSSSKGIVPSTSETGTPEIVYNIMNNEERKRPKTASHLIISKAMVTNDVNIQNIDSLSDEESKPSSETSWQINVSEFTFPRNQRKPFYREQRRLSAAHKDSFLERDKKPCMNEKWEPFKTRGNYCTKNGMETTHQTVTDFFNSFNEKFEGNEYISNNIYGFSKSVMHEPSNPNIFQRCSTENKIYSPQYGSRKFTCAEEGLAESQYALTSHSSSRTSSSIKTQCLSANEIGKFEKDKADRKRAYITIQSNRNLSIKTSQKMPALETSNPENILPENNRLSENVVLLQKGHQIGWQKTKPGKYGLNNKHSDKNMHWYERKEPKTNSVWCGNIVKLVGLSENESFIPTRKEQVGPASTHGENAVVRSKKRYNISDRILEETEQDFVINLMNRKSYQHEKNGSSCNVTNIKFEYEKPKTSYRARYRSNNHQRWPEITDKVSREICDKNSLLEENINNEILASKSRTSVQWSKSTCDNQEAMLECNEDKRSCRTETTTNFNDVVASKQLQGCSNCIKFDFPGIPRTDNTYHSHAKQDLICKPAEVDNEKKKNNYIYNKTKDGGHNRHKNSESEMPQSKLAPARKSYTPRHNKGRCKYKSSTMNCRDKYENTMAGMQTNHNDRWTNSKYMPGIEKPSTSHERSPNRPLLTTKHLPLGDKMLISDPCKVLGSEKLSVKRSKELVNKLGNERNKPSNQKQFSRKRQIFGPKKDLQINNLFADTNKCEEITRTRSKSREKTRNTRTLKMKHVQDSNCPAIDLAENKTSQSAGETETRFVPSSLNPRNQFTTSGLRECKSFDSTLQDLELSVANESNENAETKTGFSNGRMAYRKHKVENSDKSIQMNKHKNQNEQNELKVYLSDCDDVDTVSKDVVRRVDFQPINSTSEDISLLSRTMVNPNLVSSSPIVLNTSNDNSEITDPMRADLYEKKVTRQEDTINNHKKHFKRKHLVKKATQGTLLGSTNERPHRNIKEQKCVKNKHVARNPAVRSDDRTIDACADKVIQGGSSLRPSSKKNACFFKKRTAYSSQDHTLQTIPDDTSGFNINKSSNTNNFVNNRVKPVTYCNNVVQCAQFREANATATIKCSTGEIIPQSACCRGNENNPSPVRDETDVMNVDYNQIPYLLSQNAGHASVEAKHQRNGTKFPSTKGINRKQISPQPADNRNVQNIKRIRIRKESTEEVPEFLFLTHTRHKLSEFNQETNRKARLDHHKENANKQHNTCTKKIIQDKAELINTRGHDNILNKINDMSRVSSHHNSVIEGSKKKGKSQLDKDFNLHEKTHINALSESKTISQLTSCGNDVLDSKDSTIIQNTLQSGYEARCVLNTGNLFQKNIMPIKMNKIPRVVRQTYLEPAKPPQVGQSSPKNQCLRNAQEHINKDCNEPGTQENKCFVNLEQTLVESNNIATIEKSACCDNLNAKIDFNKLRALQDTGDNVIAHADMVEVSSNVDIRCGESFPGNEEQEKCSEIHVTDNSTFLNNALKEHLEKSYSLTSKTQPSPPSTERSATSTKSDKNSSSNIASNRCHSILTANPESETYNTTEVECPREVPYRRTKLVRVSRNDVVAVDLTRKPSTGSTEKHNNIKEKLHLAQVINNKDIASEARSVKQKRKNCPQSNNLNINYSSKVRKLSSGNVTLHCLNYQTDTQEDYTSGTASKSFSKSIATGRDNIKENVDYGLCPLTVCIKKESKGQDTVSKICGDMSMKNSKTPGAENTNEINEEYIGQDNKNITGRERMRYKSDWNPSYSTVSKKLLMSGVSTIKNIAEKVECTATNDKQRRKNNPRHGACLLGNNTMTYAKNITKNNNEEALVSPCCKENHSYKSRSFSLLDSGKFETKTYPFHDSLKLSRIPFSEAMNKHEDKVDNKKRDPTCSTGCERNAQFEFSKQKELNCDWYKPLKSPNFQSIISVRQQNEEIAASKNIVNQLHRVAESSEDSYETLRRDGKRVEQTIGAEFLRNKNVTVTGKRNCTCKMNSLLTQQSPADELFRRCSIKDTCTPLSSNTSSIKKNNVRMHVSPKKLQPWNGNEEKLSTWRDKTDNISYLDMQKLRSKFRKRHLYIANEAGVPSAFSSEIIKSSIPLRPTLRLNQSGSPDVDIKTYPKISKFVSLDEESSPQTLAINEEAKSSTTDSPICNINPKSSTSGFSYLYTNFSGWNCGSGRSSGQSQPRKTKATSIKVRRPTEGTFVGHIVKIFEKKLKKCIPTTDLN